MPAKLKHGVIGAMGGKRAGSGRKPEWLIAKCQKIVDRIELVEFLADVVSGKCLEAEEDRLVPASVKDRIRAAEIILERAYGKADAKVGVEIADGFFQQLEDAIRRGNVTSRS